MARMLLGSLCLGALCGCARGALLQGDGGMLTDTQDATAEDAQVDASDADDVGPTDE